jgi:hypothetical protein
VHRIGVVRGLRSHRRQRPQEQQRLGDDALSSGAVCAPPRGIERAGLAIGYARVAKPGDQLLALSLVGARSNGTRYFIAACGGTVPART